MAQKRVLLEAATVGDLLDAYLASESFKDKASSTQAIDRGRIERHLRPLLGKRHAHLLTENDIKRALAAIRDGKTSADIKTRKRGRARVKGGAGTARMAIDLLRVIFNFAIRERLVKANPCVGVKTGSSGTRETILDDAADYARLFQTLDRMELERRIRAPVADAIRLIALTGCRRGEAAGLRWSHVDLQHGRLVLPPTAHKTGRKTGKPRTIILPSTAQAIIARQPEGDRRISCSHRLAAITRSPCRRHGARFAPKPIFPPTLGFMVSAISIASHMAMAGAQAPEIMQVVGHRQLSTVQRYIHFAETAQAALAERAASVPLAGMAAGRPETGGAEVVRLKGKRR